ncbi:HAMP domain-containing protein [Thiosocius teredinicola]|uniref:HAMP domain-containing protein n=1 Tax=Thiosocius teredinicola TaxID=1973002 RepID=UPI000990B8AC
MSSEKKGLSFGIFGKILVTMLVVAAIPLSIVWYLDYSLIRDGLERNISQQLDNTSLQLANEADQWVRMNQKVLQQNATLADVRSMEREKQDPILKSILKEYDWSYLVFTTDTSGMNIGRSDGKAPKDYSSRAYVKDVVAGAPLGKQVVLGKTSGKPAVILSAPIHDPKFVRKTVAGVIAIAMNIREISERITNTVIGRTGFAFILDESGKVVAHQQEGTAPATTDFSGHPAFANKPDKGSVLLEYNDDGNHVVAAVRRSETGWYVVAQQDYDEAYAPLKDAQQRGILLLVLTLVIVSVIAYLFSQGLSRPIRNLTTIADQLSRGGSVGEIKEASRGDEIGSLASAIDRMGASIRLAIDRLKKRG